MIDNIDYKKKLLNELPLKVDGFTVRELKREDLDLYADWPEYPQPYDMFNTSLKDKPLVERDRRWEQYHQSNNSINLVVDYQEEKVVGKFGFYEIDWKEMCVNNVGIRMHPHWCDKGNGTLILKAISNWFFNNGIVKIKFDVLSTNQRAVKSYKNVGYIIIDEFKGENATFYWMELRCEENIFYRSIKQSIKL